VLINEDDYFDEFMAFKNIFKEKFDDWTKNSTSLEQKWIQIFKIFKAKHVSISNLFILFTWIKRINRTSVFIKDYHLDRRS